MRVLIVGGSGFVGTALTKELDARGHDVTVLARSPEEADLPAGVETVSGDVTDYDSIDGAFSEQDAVVNLVALSPLFQPSGPGHEEIHLGGTKHVVRACEEHGVPKLVQMSALGADPDGQTAYIRTKGKAEEVVRDSSLDWVLVRPSVVFGDGGEFVSFTKFLTTPYVTGLPGGGKTRFQPIWVGDLAPILADCVEDDSHVGQTVEIGGPEVLTLADVTKLAYRAEGKSVTILPIPMPLAGIGLSLADPLPFIPMGGDQYRSLKFDNTVAENDVSSFDRDPSDLRTLAEYLGVEDRSGASAAGGTTPGTA
ncbi:NADH dehydrogenase [Haladaptatus litoreus]|uniref:NADH dehydrogenase n=1 Tax=Haladaptatus litoreus TaxID=553468 RepID=A0A1N6YJJ9_9EURY|nr:complex I NDUFA9 subunit family protein [Haladaptatus litoreus]SIR14651.1 NADH dehydrogenase [Haladaptatus litoreus]